MRQWIKLRYDLLKDERISKLTAEHGMKGFGAYAMMRLVVDGCYPYSTTIKGIYGELETYSVSRKLINTIVSNYGLFDVDTSGYVHSVEITPLEAYEDYCDDYSDGLREGARESARESAREGAREGARKSARARESNFARSHEERELEYNNKNAAPSAWGWAEATREESMDDGGHWGDMMPAEEGIGTEGAAEGA